MKKNTCRICATLLTRQTTAKEMQLGLRETFNYDICAECECVQIAEVPVNLDKYYPAYYAPFNQQAPTLKRLPLFKRLVRGARLQRKYKQGTNIALSYLKPINARADAKILDIGCGNGVLICNLYNQGFENIGGIDKFLPHEIDYGHGVTVQKKDLAELKNQDYDVLMMHHVLEHIDEQVETLNECYRLLKSDGKLLIRIPILGEAYKIYGSNWVQFDAPRHLVLHSLKSIAFLAKKTNFKIAQVIFDSNHFQFSGSELYKKDISLYNQSTHQLIDFDQIFTKQEMEHFKNEAIRVNENGTGDQAMFYLEKLS